MSTPPDSGIFVAPLEEGDRAAVHELLAANKLPLAGLDAPNIIALVARHEGRVVGSAAIEQHGDFGLLRSVAVAESHRNRQIGVELTRHAISVARRRGLRALYLLTETAAGFFPKFGFQTVSRAHIPSEVQQSVEFTSACPASAEALVLALTGQH